MRRWLSMASARASGPLPEYLYTGQQCLGNGWSQEEEKEKMWYVNIRMILSTYSSHELLSRLPRGRSRQISFKNLESSIPI